MCVIIRDLIVYGVLTDMMRGRPAVYATFSSYDEVAHHSGLMRADTMEALRKLDKQFARIARARRFAPRPYEIVVLSDHGQTQGATFKQRNGYGLDELVERSLGNRRWWPCRRRRAGRNGRHAVNEATGHKAKKASKTDVSDRDVVVLGSGNLGLVYLMEQKRRLTLEEIEAAHPAAAPAMREHPHIGWLLVRSERHGAVALGARGATTSTRTRRGRGPARAVLAHAARPPPAHGRLRQRRRHHGRQLLRPVARRGLRVRGADSSRRLRGPQTRALILAPSLPAPSASYRGRAISPAARLARGPEARRYSVLNDDHRRANMAHPPISARCAFCANPLPIPPSSPPPSHPPLLLLTSPFPSNNFLLLPRHFHLLPSLHLSIPSPSSTLRPGLSALHPCRAVIGNVSW
jgi:hypothetical protein